MLGAVLESSFKEEHHVELCSFPRPDVRTGSFVYDVVIKNLESWTPNKNELRVLSAKLVKLGMENHPFERLDVDASIALQIFEDNEFKKAQIPYIAADHPTGIHFSISQILK